MAEPTETLPVLDHIAVAVERHDDAYPRYVGDLGGQWRSRGYAIGFAPSQVEYGNGMRVEILEPHAPERNDFLRRFLDRHGAGPHHLTFKVFDIAKAIARAEENAIHPVGVDLSDPGWLEAFLHPKDACGIVVQLAQASGGWVSPVPPPLPPPRTDKPADLTHVVHAVPALADGLHVFEQVVGGERIDAGDGWVELAYTGSGRVRLIERPDRDAGLDHVAFTVDDPAEVPGAQPQPDGTFEIPPERNHGVRLVLTAR